MSAKSFLLKVAPVVVGGLIVHFAKEWLTRDQMEG